MDDHHLDDIARSLASGTSRRAFVRAMVGATAAGLLGLTGRAAGAAKSGKVGICHFDIDNFSYRYIEVSERALPAHLAHRDWEAVACCTDDECGSGAYCRQADDGRRGVCLAPICHLEEDGGYTYMELSEEQALLHLAHGDTRTFACCTDADCGGGFCSGGVCSAAGQPNPT